MTTFIIHACTNVQLHLPLCYSVIRSVFSCQDRFVQLKQTLRSLPPVSANCRHILTECSTLTEQQTCVLKSEFPLVQIMDLSQDPIIAKQRDSAFKGATECYALQTVLLSPLFENLDLNHRIVKINARYLLNSDFDLQAHHGAFGKICTGLCPVMSTICWSFPAQLKMSLIPVLAEAALICAESPVSIESVLHQVLCKHSLQILYLKPFGISGNIAPDGEPINF